MPGVTVSPAQLRALAEIRYGQLRFMPGFGSSIDEGGKRVSIATVKALVRLGLIEQDPADDTLWRVSVSGRQLLKAHPELLATAGRQHAQEVSLAIVADIHRQARPVTLAPALESLAANIRAAFYGKGSISVDLAELPIPAAAWRALARQVARQLARPIETVAGNGMAHAALKDWPADDRERRVHAIRMRMATNNINLHLGA